MPGSLDSAARLGVLVSRWTGDSAERRLDHAHRVVGGKVEGAVNRGPSQGAHRQARDGGDVLPRQRQVSSAQGCRAPRSCREGELLVRMVRTRGDDDADIRFTIPQPQTVKKCGGLVAQAASGLDLQTGGGAAGQAEALVGLPTGEVLCADVRVDAAKDPHGTTHGGRWAGGRHNGRQLRRFGIGLHAASVICGQMRWPPQHRSPVDAAGNGQHCGHGVTASCWLPGS